MFFLGKSMFVQKYRRNGKKIVKRGCSRLAYKKECEIFALGALQIYSAIKKTDPGDKLCRVTVA